jgi:hypothetical protein
VDPERWRRITGLFEELVERPPEERSGILDRACAGDPELRREVETLLAADQRAGGFLARPPARPADAGEPDVPERIGKYEVVARIGRGGFGEVFEGRDPVIRRPVAIKTCSLPDPEVRRRFLREAEVAGRLEHPNVTTVYDTGHLGDVPFLVEEYLPGEDLETRIAEGRPATVAERLAILLQVARGLEHAHERGVVHRDVKPANVRVLPDGRVKILDFGIAKVATAPRLTATGQLPGTPAYMAPEQLLGEKVDGRADVFAFGVVAYELFSGRHPFLDGAPEGAGTAAVYRALTHNPPPLDRLWPGCPPRLAAAVARCLARDPAERFPTFTEVIAELETVAAEVETDPSLASASTARPPAGPPRRWLTGVAAAVLLALVVAVGWLRFGGGPAEEPAPAAAPAASAMAPGRLVIEARPWAEVARIVDRRGREHPAGPEPYTPLVVELPAGEYTVELRHPDLPELRRCRVRVPAAGVGRCRQEIERLDARRFFAEAGW